MKKNYKYVFVLKDEEDKNCKLTLWVDNINYEGFKEQKVTSGLDLEHVYSKDIRLIKLIYTIIQITHLILQILEHSDILGNFMKKFRSVKVFGKIFYSNITQTKLNEEKFFKIKIQIRYLNNTTVI